MVFPPSGPDTSQPVSLHCCRLSLSPKQLGCAKHPIERHANALCPPSQHPDGFLKSPLRKSASKLSRILVGSPFCEGCYVLWYLSRLCLRTATLLAVTPCYLDINAWDTLKNHRATDKATFFWGAGSEEPVKATSLNPLHPETDSCYVTATVPEGRSPPQCLPFQANERLPPKH
jgi:hypothetical protein